MKVQIIWAALAFCLNAAHAAIGQTLFPPQTFGTQPLVRSGSQNISRPTPEGLAKKTRAETLAWAAATAFQSRNYAQAESQAKQALSVDPSNGMGEEVLAQALEAQGKDQKALRQYQTVVEHYDTHPRNLLPLAQLLLKSGQWTQALALYNRVLPSLPDVGPHLEAIVVHDSDAMQASSHFSAAAPDPLGLATAIHIARGLVYNSTSGWAGDSQDTQAMAEYAKAFQLAPNNALTNYYYGTGWQKLGPAERAKFGDAQQAKAALEKAVKLGKPDVKEAAQKALLVAAKP